MSQFDSIRPFYDAEVNAAIREIVDDTMLDAMMQFTFPEDQSKSWKERMKHTHSLRDFQINHYRNHEGQITRDDPSASTSEISSGSSMSPRSATSIWPLGDTNVTSPGTVPTPGTRDDVTAPSASRE